MAIRVVKAPDFMKIARESREKRKQVLEKEMLFARTEIITKTNRGQDVEDSSFAPYSDDYADWRKERGYQASPPNLTITGAMLRAIQLTVTEKPQSLVGILLFASALEAVKARSVNKLREFFALSTERVQRIVTALNGRG